MQLHLNHLEWTTPEARSCERLEILAFWGDLAPASLGTARCLPAIAPGFNQNRTA
jgi:hypothetical protein